MMKMKVTMRERMAVILVVLVLGSCVCGIANGQSPNECNQEKNRIENSCRSVAFGHQPSAACCQLIRVARVQCVCPYVTPKLTALIGAQRLIRLVQGCGRPVPRNFKCGSKLTMPSKNSSVSLRVFAAILAFTNTYHKFTQL